MAELTFSEVDALLKCDPETGTLFWKHRPTASRKWNERYAGTEAGPNSISSGYKQCVLLGKQYYAHRLIWLLTTGAWPVGQIDHINGNKTDNRIDNLRDVSNRENGKNQRPRKNNTSGIMGVYWYKNCRKWNAQIKVGDKLVNLGYFTEIEDAARARKDAEMKYGFHENHGRVNV